MNKWTVLSKSTYRYLLLAIVQSYCWTILQYFPKWSRFVPNEKFHSTSFIQHGPLLTGKKLISLQKIRILKLFLTSMIVKSFKNNSNNLLLTNVSVEFGWFMRIFHKTKRAQSSVFDLLLIRYEMMKQKEITHCLPLNKNIRRHGNEWKKNKSDQDFEQIRWLIKY